MKNKFLLSMMLLCFACFGEMWAEEVTIGETTATSQFLPSNCNYNYSLTQQIFTANEIGTVGTISSVSFYCTSYDAQRSYDIYLVNTNKSTFNGASDWIAVTDADKVFSGSVTMLRNQWNTIVLNTPFEYDGTHNLALIVDDNTGSPYVYNNILATGEDVAIDLSAYQGTNLMIAFYGESTVTNNGDNNLHIDNVSIDYIPTCQKPTNFHVSNITGRSVVLSWDAPEGQNHWEVGYKTDDDPYYQWFTEPTENPYVFSGHPNHPLQPETHYTVMVRALCDGSGSSSWSKEVEFATPLACPVPTDVSVLSTTAHGFWASFTPGGDWQTSWEFAVTTENTAPTISQSNTTDPEGFGWDDSPYIMAGTTYYLWVGIYCEEDHTYHWGEPAQFTTPYACSKVYAQDVEIDDVQPHEVSLDWSAYQGSATQWQVYHNYYEILPNDEAYINEVAVTTDGTYVTIDGLAGDTDCHFWIRSYCEDWYGTPQYSEWSDMITVHTEVSCYPPTNVTVSDITGTSAYISWEPGGTNQIEWEVTIGSDDWSDPYVVNVDEPFVELDFGDGWLDEPVDLPCTVYVSANCGDDDGWSANSEVVDFILTDKEQLTVNDGTSTNEFVPIYGYYCDQYSKGQFIIPAEDIENMQYSEIILMKFYATNDYVDWGNAEFEVFMMELPCETEFASTSPYDWEDMDLVRSEGSLYIRDGLMVVDLEEPFYYTDGNLLIGFKQTVKGSYIRSNWYGVNTNANTALGGYETSKGINFKQFLPKTTFVYAPTGNTVCRKPKNFTVRKVDVTRIECSWTPGSNDQSLWEVAWGGENFDPDDNTTWISHTITEYNPCWLTDFEPEMTYVFAARAVCNQSPDVYSNWTCPLIFTMPEACPTPTNIEVSNITPASATISWENGEGNETWLLFRRVGYDEKAYYEGFEHEVAFNAWTTINMGTSSENANEFGRNTIAAKTGSYGFRFSSYNNDENGVYDQYLISPNVSQWQSKDFCFAYRSSDNAYESFKVGFSTTDTDIESFTWSDEIMTSQTDWQTYQGIIPSNAVYIAIHYYSYFAYRLYVDDFTIYTGNHIQPTVWYGVWATSPFTITQYYPNGESVMYLEPNTTYEYQMITACNGGASQGGMDSHWTDVMSFTTLDDGFKVFVNEGDWSTDDNWSPAGSPTMYHDVIVRANAEIPDGCMARAYSIVYEGSPTPTLTIKDGGQLIHNNAGVVATVQKNITGRDNGGGWNFIASPVATVVPSAENGLLSGDYDLYYYHEGTHIWRNYKGSQDENHANPGFSLTNGKGYLYANIEDITLSFTGALGTLGEVALDFNTDEAAVLPGWNLVGNPFPCNVTSSLPYYFIDGNTNQLNGEPYQAGTVIPSCTGIMVKAEASDQSVTFTKVVAQQSNRPSGLQIAVAQTNTRTNTAEDKAIVSFSEGNQLEKFIFDADLSKLYIPQDGKDYAIVTAEAQGEIPVNFRAAENGPYTITVSPENVEMGYLHLIDNMTGADVDLLAGQLVPEPVEGPGVSTSSTTSYTFTAKTTDYVSRFKLIFSVNDEDGPSTGSGTFAFYGNGNIIINGKGTVQLIDMTGHIIVSVDGHTRCIPTAGMTPGVYVLRLIDGNDVKTQKMVIR